MKKYLVVMGSVVFVSLVASETNERSESLRSRPGSRGRVSHARKESVSPMRTNRSQNLPLEVEQKESVQEPRKISQKSSDFLTVPYNTSMIIATLNKSSRSIDEIIEEFNV